MQPTTPVDSNAVKPPEASALRGGVITAIIRAYHTNRVTSDFVAHILSKYDVQSAFAALASTDTPASKPIASNAAVERVFDIIWPLQEWDGDPNVCRIAARLVVAALTEPVAPDDGARA